MGRRLLAMWVLVACSKRDDREARELATLVANEPLMASERVRAWVGSCNGLGRALDRLNASGVTSRDLFALVDEAIQEAERRCSAERGVPEDAIDHSHARLMDLSRGDGIAHRLARARLHGRDLPRALAALSGGGNSVAMLVRRAELLDQLRRPQEALVEIDLALALSPDGPTRQQRLWIAVAAVAQAGRYDEVARMIAEARVDHRPALANRAASALTPEQLAGLLSAAVEPELATAVGDRIEYRDAGSRDPRAAVPARTRAVELGPDRAEHHDAYARALAANGQIEPAIAAWERAAAIAPAQPSYRVAPVRALVAAELYTEARGRSHAIAEAARTRGDVDALLVASNAAAIAREHRAAMQLVREARALRPGDGRIAFALAERLADAGERAAAIDAYAELLVCGAHGRPWHRHEVAGKLVALATDAASAKLVEGALDLPRACTVDARELAHFVDNAREHLAKVAP